MAWVTEVGDAVAWYAEVFDAGEWEGVGGGEALF